MLSTYHYFLSGLGNSVSNEPRLRIAHQQQGALLHAMEFILQF